MPRCASPTKVVRERGHVTEADRQGGPRPPASATARSWKSSPSSPRTCFTNFLNEVAKTDIDFPVVRAAEAA